MLMLMKSPTEPVAASYVKARDLVSRTRVPAGDIHPRPGAAASTACGKSMSKIVRRHRPVRAWERRAIDAVVGEDHQFPPALIAGPQQRGHDLRCHASSPARELPVEPGA